MFVVSSWLRSVRSRSSSRSSWLVWIILICKLQNGLMITYLNKENINKTNYGSGDLLGMEKHSLIYNDYKLNTYPKHKFVTLITNITQNIPTKNTTLINITDNEISQHNITQTNLTILQKKKPLLTTRHTTDQNKKLHHQSTHPTQILHLPTKQQLK